jgi:myo-inositol catabolism protein IolC
MALGYDGKLYILAFDHRGSFQKQLFGITGDPTVEERRRISDAKRVIFEGLARSLDDGIPREWAGALVDEQFGADVAREAKERGFLLAMPAEKSGQDEFDFQYGEEFGAHIEAFDPAFVKVLVRYNPEGDSEMNERQGARLRRLSEWLHERGRKFLFELLIPAEPHQLAAVDGDTGRFDRDIRPRLLLDVIRELHAAGIEPDVWKIEGLDSRQDCLRAAELARSGGRDGVVCVVLGRGAKDEAVEHWLRQGAGVPGYVGFAIGRTFWWDALVGYRDGDIDRDEAAEVISGKYRHMVEVYEAATREYAPAA